MAQYRAIFKRAYIKGIASAVLLTAGLAVGQAQAVALDDSKAADLANGDLTLIIGSDTDSGTTKYYESVSISGGGSANTWNAAVIVQKGATTANKIEGSAGAVNITGSGSLTIEVADSYDTNGLAINAHTSNDTSVSIDSIAVNKGTLAITDAASHTAKVLAKSITIGEDPAPESTPDVLAAGDPAGILSLTASGDGGSVTLGTAGETSIEVKSTGQLKVTVDSGTATINGTSLALNEKAFMLVENGANKGNTLTVASDTFTIDQDAVHVISSEASAKAVIEKFTGSTANIGGNVLITAESTLDLSTDITGTEANDGVVTLAEGSNTVVGGTIAVNKGTLDVASGAALHAAEGATGAKIEVKNNNEADSVTLKIDSSALDSFLNGGQYTAINEDGSLGDANAASGDKGQITLSGGATNKLAVLYLTDTDEVDLSDFNFSGGGAAKGVIYTQSNAVIKGNDIRISEQLTNGTTDLTGSSSNIKIEATSLTLGDNNDAATDYGFKSAQVANLYNGANGAITLGNPVTLDATVGADNIETDANGKFSGNFVLTTAANSLTVEQGTYTHNGSLTINGTGALTVQNTASSKVNTKLTLTELNLQAGTGTAITVDGKNNTNGATTTLDLSNIANNKFTVNGAANSGTITVKDSGTLVATADQVKAILDVKETKGFVFEINKGTLEVEGNLELDTDKIDASKDSGYSDKKLSFHSGNGGYLTVNGELTLNKAGTVNLANVKVATDKLVLNTETTGTKSVLSGGEFTAWSSLGGNNGVNVSGANLYLGGFDANGAAISTDCTIKTDLTLKDGNVTIQNGSWKGANQTITVDAGKFKVGDATKHGASGSTFDTSLTVKKLDLKGGNTLIDTVGSVTVNDLTASGDTLDISGSMTVNGLAVAADAENPNYGVHLASGSIDVGENAELTFKANAVKAINVNTSNVSGSGYISAVDGTFGKANPTDAQTVINAAVGSTVTFEFDSSTSFRSEALAEFRKEIFGLESGNLAGFVNLGDAQIAGLTDAIKNNAIVYDDLQGYIDVNSDFTTEALQNVKVTGIDSSSELRGSLGSLSSTELSAGDQIAVDGNLALNNAADNGGKFAANAAGEVLGLDVTQNVQVNLNNGGEIGTVSFDNEGSFVVASENGTTTIGAIDGAKAKTQFITGTATVKGITETAQLTTAADTNTIFEGEVTVGKQGTASDVSSLAGNTNFKAAATFAQDAVVANTGSAHFAGNVDFQGNASLYGDTTVDGIATADKGLKIDQGAVVTINNLVTSGNVLVGSIPTKAGNEDTAGTLSVTTMDLNGYDLVADPDWNNVGGLTFVGVDKFSDASASDAGILNGNAYALQNAILSIGNKDKAEVLDIFGKFINAQGNLSNDKDGVGAIVYVADTVKVAAGHKIVADKTLNQNTYTNATYSADGAFIGKNSVLGVEVSAANGFKDDGVTPQAAITFTNAATVYSDKTGKILLTGDYDQSDRITLFDSENGQVKVSGDAITVETINGLLTFNYDGKKSFNISEMTVDTKRAQSAFSATSSPVHDALVAYGTGNTDWRNAATNTDDENAMAKTHGAAVSGIVFFNGKFYYESKVENKDPTDEVKDPEITKLLTTVKVENPDYDPQNPGSVPQYLDKVVYKADNPLLSAINNQQANSGISAESAARMADFAGVAQVALKAGSSTSEAISGRMGMGAQNSAITYANNGQGAGLWVTPIYMNSDSDGFEAQGISYGTDINLYGVALGGDYTLANGIRVGAMFNVGSGDVDGQGAGSNVSSDFDYYSFGLYAGYTMGQFSIAGDVSYTAVDNDLEANTEFADIGKLETSLDSSNISFGVTGAYAFDTAAGVKVTPHVGLRYSYIDIDDYTVGSKAGAIGSYSADSLSVFSIPVGVTIASEFNAGSWSVKPSFDVTLTGNFGDDENEGTFHWDGVENIDSGLTSEIFDNFTYGATLGIAAQSASGISLGLSVGYTGSSNVDDFGVNANARFTF